MASSKQLFQDEKSSPLCDDEEANCFIKGTKNAFETPSTTIPFKLISTSDQFTQMKEIVCYKNSFYRGLGFTFLRVISLGIFALFEWWFPVVRIIQYSRCSPLEAQVLDIWDICDERTLVPFKKLNLQDGTERWHFNYKHTTFVYEPDIHQAESLSHLRNVSLGELKAMVRNPLNADQVESRRLVFGRCEFDLQSPSPLRILVEEVIHPFIVFQAVSIFFWFVTEYEVYATAIGVMTLTTIIFSYITTRQTIKELEELTSHRYEVEVTRTKLDGTTESLQIDSTELVPGDILTITPGMTMPCDVVLVRGSCIVDEGMLTGEATPVVKSENHQLTTTEMTTLTNTKVNPSALKHSLLYTGTLVTKAKSSGNLHTQGIIVETGFCTRKGELLKEMLHPQELSFDLYSDSFSFIVFFAVLALGAIVFVIKELSRYSPDFVFYRVLDMITVIIPPALPTALTIGTFFAVMRLKEKAIRCLAPSRVNVVGRITSMFFDKTGTLTEDQVKVQGLRVSQGATLGHPLQEIDETDSRLFTDKTAMCMSILGACNSILLVDGNSFGDQLELEMLEYSPYELEDVFSEEKQKWETHVVPSKTYRLSEFTSEWRIVKRFEFDAELRRSSVIVEKLSGLDKGTHHVFVKGSPEQIMELCKPENTPGDVHSEFSKDATKGYRILGLASRQLPSQFKEEDLQSTDRHLYEAELEFAGGILFDNNVKWRSKPVIKELAEANISSTIVTGDNIFTAISVGYETSILNPSAQVFVLSVQETPSEGVASVRFSKYNPGMSSSEGEEFTTSNAMTINLASNSVSDPFTNGWASFAFVMGGNTFSQLLALKKETKFGPQIEFLIQNTAVFARMTPEEKADLIELHITAGKYVGMAGDGANDSIALRQASMGLSIGSSESSLLASFSTPDSDVGCVPYLLREGRCALTVSFDCFKWMAMYALIQLVTVAILTTHGGNLTDNQYLWIDMMILLSLGISMAYSRPCDHLTVELPESRLVAKGVIFSILGQFCIQAGFQLFTLQLLRWESWYTPTTYPEDPEYYEAHSSTECSVLFVLSCSQYVMTLVAFILGKGFKEPMYKNVWFMGCLITLCAINVWMVFPSDLVIRFFALKDIPLVFRQKLLVVMIGNAIITFLYERVVVPRLREPIDIPSALTVPAKTA